MIRRTTLHVTLMLTAALTAACGGDKTASPASPSAAVPVAAAPAPPAAGAVAGATISGTVVGTTPVTSAIRRLSTAGMTVTVSSTSSASVVDDSGHFELHGVPAGHVDLHFSGAGNDAHVGLDDVAEREEIHLTVRVNGATADVDDNAREDNGKVEVEGRVTQTGAGTLRIGDTTVSVPAGTPIRRGGTTVTLADIHVDDRVHVHGTGTRAAVTATSIELQSSNSGQPTPTPAPGGDDRGEVELKGTLSGRTGTCPALTFTVASTAVVTSAATEFKDSACSALANGNTVEVKGTRSGTKVNATRVEKKK